MMRRLSIIAIGLILFGSNAFSRGSGGDDADQILPTAKGRTGPVGLQLTLLQSKIKIGENLFVKTSLTNFSKDPMPVADWIYRGSRNLGDVWSDDICNTRYPAIEVRDSKGHRVKPDPYHDLSGSDSPFTQTVGTPRPDTRLKTWKSEGLRDVQISERLQKEENAREDADRDAKYPGIVLKHGQSVDSVSWCSGRKKENTAMAITCPGNGFVELAAYNFKLPGRYRVRAVRDSRPSKEFQKWTDQWDIRAATDWIYFEVVR